MLLNCFVWHILTDLYSQYFDSGNLTAGNHTITITSLLDNEIYFDYFLVPAIGTTPSGLNLFSQSLSNSTNPPIPGSHSHAGAIAGGVIGGLAALAIIAALILFSLRRRQQRFNDQHRGDILPQVFPPRSGIHNLFIL